MLSRQASTSTMASPVSPISMHRSSNSAPGYFEYQPVMVSGRPAIDAALDSPSVHRLDAFHQRPSTVYDYPKNAHIYARRALPPLPQINTLRKSSSSKTLRPQRPSLSPEKRAYTSDDFSDRPLPPLPLLTRRPSAESCVSAISRPSEEVAPLPRPRAMRSTSFRNFFNRNTYPQSQSSSFESTRSFTSMSATSDADSHDSRHDSVLGDMGLTTVKAPSPTTSQPGSRRPSTLSLSSLRSRKVSPPEVSSPCPRPGLGARKGSTSAGVGRRWNIFGGSGAEDVENMPAVPITPPPVEQLSCHRCYYYSMRNCNGWVMGGSHGDACDSCTVSLLSSNQHVPGLTSIRCMVSWALLEQSPYRSLYIKRLALPTTIKLCKAQPRLASLPMSTGWRSDVQKPFQRLSGSMPQMTRDCCTKCSMLHQLRPKGNGQ